MNNIGSAYKYYINKFNKTRQSSSYFHTLQRKLWLPEEQEESSDQNFDSDDSFNDNDVVEFSEHGTDSEESLMNMSRYIYTGIINVSSDALQN